MRAEYFHTVYHVLYSVLSVVSCSRHSDSLGGSDSNTVLIRDKDFARDATPG